MRRIGYSYDDLSRPFKVTSYDANFNITGLVQENQTFVERYVYTPFGDRTVLTGTFGSRSSTSYDWQLGHQGLRIDTESGTYYNRGRQRYHPGIGGFTQRDPLGSDYQDGMNLYQPYRGNPVVYTDSSGYCCGVTVPSEAFEWQERQRVLGLIAESGAQRAILYTKLVNLCPRTRTNWKSQCCDPDDCIKQAGRLADKIVGAVLLQRINSPQMGGTAGNVTGGNQCGDWQQYMQDASIAALEEFQAEGKSCFVVTSVDATEEYALWVNTYHNWIEISGPGGGPVVIDPWPTAGQTIVDSSHTQGWDRERRGPVTSPKWKPCKK
ncbi:MAG: hypothetical protein KatS3mg104_0229 [Phycisphaerae bacterium]|nr:MAG: hypothetical protein KatS3mg104_0229 [Phycisphaerae bacterium]